MRSPANVPIQSSLPTATAIVMLLNWLMAGLYAKPTKTIKLKAGYRWIRIRVGSKWENRNQLVTGLAWVF